MRWRGWGIIGLVVALLATSLEWPVPVAAAAKPANAAASPAGAEAPASAAASASVDARSLTGVTMGSPASGYVAIPPTRVLDTRARGGKPVKAGATVTA